MRLSPYRSLTGLHFVSFRLLFIEYAGTRSIQGILVGMSAFQADLETWTAFEALVNAKIHMDKHPVPRAYFKCLLYSESGLQHGQNLRCGSFKLFQLKSGITLEALYWLNPLSFASSPTMHDIVVASR